MHRRCRHVLREPVYDPNNAHANKALAGIAKSVMNAVDKMKKERDKDDKDLKYKWKKGGGP